MRTPTELDRLAESWQAIQVDLRPEQRVWLGWNGDQTQYADYSPDGIAAYRDAAADMLRRVSATPVVDAVDEVTAAELRRTGQLTLDRFDAEVEFSNLNNLECPAQSVRMIFDLMPTGSDEDWASIAKRMHHIPAALAGYTETLREGIRRGTTPARRQIVEVITQASAYAESGGFFDRLANHDACGALGSALATGAAEARRAYGDLVTFLREELAPAATEVDGVGREHYELASQEFLGAVVDLDETYEWGLEELARMTAEQAVCAEQILPGATIPEVMDHLDADSGRQLHGTEALREWMQGVADQAVAELGATHFDIPDPMRAIECMIAPTQEGGIYYTDPSDDFSRPGRMWWSVPAGVDTFTTWREVSTVYHEGVPGHHLQIARAIYVKDQLNSWRRMNMTSGHAEGWALYAERLMEEIGYLDDPGDRLGMLAAQRFRAARVAIDIGVHLGKTVPDGDHVWDYDYALDFLAANSTDAPENVRFEVNRYFGWPGQAPSYKIGQRIWEELRADAATRPDFDLKSWHMRALNLGGVGLDTLRAALSQK